jgi:hypothetical protein
MATENNKNLKYTTRNGVKPKRKKLKEINQINGIKNVINVFINALKTKHL